MKRTHYSESVLPVATGILCYMLSRFRAHLVASGLISQGDKVLVGYSGGPDSTCLVCLLQDMGVDFVAAHLHHGQREEADIEEKLCGAFCDERGIPFISGKANVPRMAEELGIGIEEAGRRARYAFFEQASFQLGCSLVATAHTRSDVVETVLLNLARGTGLAGLSGIPPKRDNIIRPLLPFSRSETQDYCVKRGLWTHDDPSNTDVSFSRARIRHRVLPELHAINPRAEEAIARLADLAGSEDKFLNGIAASSLERSEVKLNGALNFLTADAEVCFDRSFLVTLPATLFRRAIRLAAGTLGAKLNHEQVGAILKGVAEGERGSITAEGGIVAIEWGSESLALRNLSSTEAFKFPLAVPGITRSDEYGWQFDCEVGETGGVIPARASLQTAIDKSKLKGGLYARAAESGDKIQPLGFTGHRKLSDLFREAGLSQVARARLPIVCDMVGPVWAPGVCLDERVKPNEGSTSEIRLAFTQVSYQGSHNEGNGAAQ